MAKDKAGQASDALEEGARQAADAAQKVSKDTSEAIESGAQQARSLVSQVGSPIVPFPVVKTEGSAGVNSQMRASCLTCSRCGIAR